MTNQWELSDFVPNLEHGSGVSHAFNEPLRGGPTKKSCVHGTNCPDCLDFLTLAGPGYVAPSHVPDWNSETSRVSKLTAPSMGPGAAGKHKSIYRRSSTPPGFWNSGFPSTQETKRNNEEARKKVESEVRERAKESVQWNGRYRFKDERVRKRIEDILSG